MLYALSFVRVLHLTIFYFYSLNNLITERPKTIFYFAFYLYTCMYNFKLMKSWFQFFFCGSFMAARYELSLFLQECSNVYLKHEIIGQLMPQMTM